MSKPYTVAVFIGRMAPLHNAHLENIQKAAEIADQVVVILGSANAPRDERNPFSNDQRVRFVAYATRYMKNVHINTMNDMPSNELWAATVMRLATAQNYNNGKIAIVGHKKDESSFYLDLFPTWDFIETGAHMFGDAEMAATQIRTLMFEGRFEEAKPMMPRDIWKNINDEFIGADPFREILAEYQFHKHYPAHRRAKYPILEQTADSVVICSGHILLIRRKNIPGKGKLALPGGFVNLEETVLDAAVRELLEETCLHVPEKVIRGSIIDEKRFDAPNRSLRGRIITTTFTVKLEPNFDGKLPRVYANDDAVDAQWVPISELIDPMEASNFFEDHYHIIQTMIGRCAGR